MGYDYAGLIMVIYTMYSYKAVNMMLKKNI